jgi:transcriptional regulator with XRE-family HTH domain
VTGLPQETSPATVTARFAAAVRAELGARGWPASRLMQHAGLPPSALTPIWQGHSPSLDRAAAIAEALGIPLSDLIGDRAGEPGREAPWQP